MKPIKEFIDTKSKSIVGFTNDFRRIIDTLDEAGYYCMLPIHSSSEHGRYGRYVDWCRENCPKDFYTVLGIIYFTNKEIVTLMKLSVL